MTEYHSENTLTNLEAVESLVQEVKENYHKLVQEWTALQKELQHQIAAGSVYVKRDDLARLATEITQLKQNLPKVLPQDTTLVNRSHHLQEENERLKAECCKIMEEANHWRSRYETAISDTQTEKQECLKLQCEVQALSQQLSQQSEYCSSLGSACCTLLWRVSSREDSAQAILSGTKVDEFLSLVSSTLESYLLAYKGDWPKDEEEESRFILALCGIVTNLAASAYGRDFLSSNTLGKKVLDTFITLLTQVPPGKSIGLKNLMVMCLYNISINQKGIKFLVSKKGLLSLTAWLLQGEADADLRLNCLRLIQSLLYDTNNVNAIHEINEVLPVCVLEQMAKDVNQEIRELALEFITDLKQIQAPSEL